MHLHLVMCIEGVYRQYPEDPIGEYARTQLADDVARVAVGLLTAPTLVPGTAYPLIGATISLKDIIARAATVLLDNEVTVKDVERALSTVRKVHSHG